MPAHLRPSAPTAPDAILCGDPARALAIAQRLLVRPRMSNHHRGLWGYHGETGSGAELTVQATGIGGPSAAIVIGELAELGLRRAIRIGTCAAPGPAPGAGSMLAVREALAADGTSVALGVTPGAGLLPDPELAAGLLAAPGVVAVTVESRDLPPRGDLTPPAVVGDLQTAAVLAAADRHDIVAAAGLVVGSAAGRRLEDEPLEAGLLKLASAAAETLASSSSTRG